VTATPKDPASPAGQWWPAATGPTNVFGATLADNTLTADPNLPGFPDSNRSTNLGPNDFWAVNTVRPLRGPAGGYAVPAIILNTTNEAQGIATTLIPTTNGFAVSQVPAPFSSTPPASRLPLQTYDTIGDRLNDAGISWAWFSGGWANARRGLADSLFQFHHQPFAYFAKYALAASPVYPANGATNPPVPGVDSVDPEGKPFGYGLGSANHLADEDLDFYRLLDAGTLPQVSFVKPAGENNSHPGYASVKRGQAWVANIVGRIQHSPVWNQTVVFICYDEHGGLYDHVAPPVIDRWGPGSRIPFIIASPWSKKGFVDHNPYETVSILSFIEHLHHLPPLNRHDAEALPPVAAFLGQPDLFLEARTGQTVAWQIPAYNNPVAYAWSGGEPDGLFLNPATGLISGTPTQSGTYPVNVTVTGVAGQPLQYALQIDVH